MFIGEHFTPKRGLPSLTGSDLRRRGTAWVAREAADGSALGTVFLVEATSPFRQIAHDHELEVHLMAVRRTARRQGIADALLEACLTEARLRTAPRVVLSTQPIMVAAHALYEKHGFTRLPDRDWVRSDNRTFLVYGLELAG